MNIYAPAQIGNAIVCYLIFNFDSLNNVASPAIRTLSFLILQYNCPLRLEA
ncbi:hypothetical protein [uncultured Methanobrevibacter sp.]|uniref:hypothetical protein n=1 Tax=uncultured Methanobrevibacter sp. TaxID=253161 RepID=UPI0025F59AC4|nr:hypothetical protein [uncultured Methanobrevibacter sp.]